MIEQLEQVFVAGRVRAVFRIAAFLDGYAQHGIERLARHDGNAGEPAVGEVGLSDEFERHVISMAKLRFAGRLVRLATGTEVSEGVGDAAGCCDGSRISAA